MRRGPEAFDGALTIDLEDWHCALNPSRHPDYRTRPPPDKEYLRTSTAKILKELDDADIRATFFVLGEVARAVPEVIEMVAAKGHEIASHSPVHLPPRLIPREEFASMMKDDVELLESLSGKPPVGFRTPYLAIGRHDGWVLETVAKCGILYDSSVSATWTPYWGIPSAPKRAYFPNMSDIARRSERGPIVELPVSVWPTTVGIPGLPIGGGFYMRAWPMPFLIWMLKRNVAREHPLVLYVHQGNIEMEKERIPNPTLRDRISQYAGLSRGLTSFRRIARQFRLGPMCTVFKEEIERARENRG